MAKLLKNWLTRLGSIRRELRMKDEVTILFGDAECSFVPSDKENESGSEFQVGLQALTQERNASGLNFVEPAKQPAQAFNASPVSALA